MEHKAVGQRCPAAFISRISTAWHGIEKEAQESFLPYSTRQVAEVLGEKPLEKLTRVERRRVAELLLESVTVGLDEMTMDIRTAGMEALAGEAWNEDQN